MFGLFSGVTRQIASRCASGFTTRSLTLAGKHTFQAVKGSPITHQSRYIFSSTNFTSRKTAFGSTPLYTQQTGLAETFTKQYANMSTHISKITPLYSQISLRQRAAIQVTSPLLIGAWGINYFSNDSKTDKVETTSLATKPPQGSPRAGPDSAGNADEQIEAQKAAGSRPPQRKTFKRQELSQGNPDDDDDEEEDDDDDEDFDERRFSPYSRGDDDDDDDEDEDDELSLYPVGSFAYHEYFQPVDPVGDVEKDYELYMSALFNDLDVIATYSDHIVGTLEDISEELSELFTFFAVSSNYIEGFDEEPKAQHFFSYLQDTGSGTEMIAGLSGEIQSILAEFKDKVDELESKPFDNLSDDEKRKRLDDARDLYEDAQMRLRYYVDSATEVFTKITEHHLPIVKGFSADLAETYGEAFTNVYQELARNEQRSRSRGGRSSGRNTGGSRRRQEEYEDDDDDDDYDDDDDDDDDNDDDDGVLGEDEDERRRRLMNQQRKR